MNKKINKKSIILLIVVIVIITTIVVSIIYQNNKNNKQEEQQEIEQDSLSLIDMKNTENAKIENGVKENTSEKEIKVESKKAVTTGDNTNSIVPIVLLGISLLGIYMIVMKKYVR